MAKLNWKGLLGIGAGAAAIGLGIFGLVKGKKEEDIETDASDCPGYEDSDEYDVDSEEE